MGQTVIELIENSEGRQELWQWDLGRKVRVIPSEGITVDEVHFGNVFSGEALVVEPKVDETTGDIVADVPNILITQFFRINVYAVMVIPDGKITTERIMLDVEAREKPSDYIYTETEIKNYDALVKRIEALENYIPGSGGGGINPEQLQAVIDEALRKAKESGEFDGKDGYTPQKGIDYFDGKDGLNGADGADGKSAYQYAKDGGYTGTEKEFAQKMAKELPTKLSDLENDLELEVEGTVEITDGEPTKESTVMTLNPNAEEVNLYTAPEIDEMLQNLQSGSEWKILHDITTTEDVSVIECEFEPVTELCVMFNTKLTADSVSNKYTFILVNDKNFAESTKVYNNNFASIIAVFKFCKQLVVGAMGDGSAATLDGTRLKGLTSQINIGPVKEENATKIKIYSAESTNKFIAGTRLLLAGR